MMKKQASVGSNGMKEAGYIQVSLYFKPDVIKKIDAIAKKSYRKRSQVVSGFVLKALEKVK